jgi:hypothetical protein
MHSRSSGLPERIRSSLKSNDCVNVFAGQHTRINLSGKRSFGVDLTSAVLHAVAIFRVWTSRPMQYIGCIGESPGISESAGAEFSFCMLSTPPSTYTPKIIGSSSNSTGAARESPSCGWMVSTPKLATFQPKLAGPAREVECSVGCT